MNVISLESWLSSNTNNNKNIKVKHVLGVNFFKSQVYYETKIIV